MGIMTSIKYIFPEFVATYPYWAKDEKNDLFLVVCPGRGIAVELWQTVQDVSELRLTRLPGGTKIEIIQKQAPSCN